MVFVGALVVFSVLPFVIPDSVQPNESKDYSGFYRPVAENVLQGEGLKDMEGGPATRYPPGYPLVLTAVFAAADAVGVSHDIASDAFKVLALAATCLVLFLITRLLFPPPVAWLAALLWATYPINLMVATQPYSEIPFTLVLYVLVFLLLRGVQTGQVTARLTAVVGLLVGVCSLIRPMAILMALPLVAVVWFWSADQSRRRRIALGAALVAGNVLVLAPWEIWAWERTGEVIPLSSGGTESIVAGLTVGSHDDQEGEAGLPADVADLMADAAAQRDSFETTGDIARFLADEFGERPITVVKLMLVKAARSWYATDSLRHESYVALLQLPYLLLAGGGLVLAFRGESFVRRAGALVVVLTLYHWVVTITVTSIIRIMSPVAGLLLPFAAVAVFALYARLARRSVGDRTATLEPAGRQA